MVEQVGEGDLGNERKLPGRGQVSLQVSENQTNRTHEKNRFSLQHPTSGEKETPNFHFYPALQFKLNLHSVPVAGNPF